MKKTKVIIMGAAGRDFHNFNIYFRNNPNYEVVAFTAEQIPGIAGRKYPRELAGRLYKKGIKIYPEDELPKLIKKFDVDKVVLSYSDLPYMHLMHKAAIVNASGADFVLLGPNSTMLKSKKRVIAVCAVRTGCGKSQTTRYISEILKRKKIKFVVVRHPMPYGYLRKQICQRFETYADLKKYNCTIEEREEYEPQIEMGNIVYAGVDYEKILREAEKEADFILWDGGNNDFPFIKPDLLIVLTDPLRPGHELTYYPGEVNLRMADIVIINKENNAPKKNVEIVRKNIRKVNPKAIIIDANSRVKVEGYQKIREKRVLIVEDGPTLTHGGMPFGAGYIAAKRHKCRIIDPRPFAVGSIKNTFKKYKHLGKILPAMGYSKKQIKELEQTINRANCDFVISGTPIHLGRILRVNKPIVRIRYELVDIAKKPNLDDVIVKFLKKVG
jgi:predicted GTPase